LVISGTTTLVAPAISADGAPFVITAALVADALFATPGRLVAEESASGCSGLFRVATFFGAAHRASEQTRERCRHGKGNVQIFNLHAALRSNPVC
jgi:hypothetical protein